MLYLSEFDEYKSNRDAWRLLGSRQALRWMIQARLTSVNGLLCFRSPTRHAGVGHRILRHTLSGGNST